MTSLQIFRSFFWLSKNRIKRIKAKCRTGAVSFITAVLPVIITAVGRRVVVMAGCGRDGVRKCGRIITLRGRTGAVGFPTAVLYVIIAGCGMDGVRKCGRIFTLRLRTRMVC